MEIFPIARQTIGYQSALLVNNQGYYHPKASGAVASNVWVPGGEGDTVNYWVGQWHHYLTTPPAGYSVGTRRYYAARVFYQFTLPAAPSPLPVAAFLKLTLRSVDLYGRAVAPYRPVKLRWGRHNTMGWADSAPVTAVYDGTTLISGSDEQTVLLPIDSAGLAALPWGSPYYVTVFDDDERTVVGVAAALYPAVNSSSPHAAYRLPNEGQSQGVLISSASLVMTAPITVAIEDVIKADETVVAAQGEKVAVADTFKVGGGEEALRTYMADDGPGGVAAHDSASVAISIVINDHVSFKDRARVPGVPVHTTVASIPLLVPGRSLPLNLNAGS